jgi:Protein of unknown function (DUF2384)
MSIAMDTPIQAPQAGAVVGKAVMTVARELEITAATLARIIGVSAATLSRMSSGGFRLEAGSKPFELAVLLIRLYRSLDAIAGGDRVVAASWMKNGNAALGGRPIDKVQTVSGLVDVIAYLDARRAPV